MLKLIALANGLGEELLGALVKSHTAACSAKAIAAAVTLALFKPLKVSGLAFLDPEKHERAADHDRPHAGPNRDVDRLFVLYR